MFVIEKASEERQPAERVFYPFREMKDRQVRVDAGVPMLVDVLWHYVSTRSRQR